MLAAREAPELDHRSGLGRARPGTRRRTPGSPARGSCRPRGLRPLGGCVRGIVEPGDFERFDLILAMDRENLQVLRRRAPPGRAGAAAAVPGVAPETGPEMLPDPYLRRPNGFEEVLDLIEAGPREACWHTCPAQPARPEVYPPYPLGVFSGAARTTTRRRVCSGRPP